MADERLIGKFDKVSVWTDGPDVILKLPKNPARAHWTDFMQVANGILMAVRQAQQWEIAKKQNGGQKG